MTAVARVCSRVSVSTSANGAAGGGASSSTATLYDCQGHAAALRAAAAT